MNIVRMIPNSSLVDYLKPGHAREHSLPHLTASQQPDSSSHDSTDKPEARVFEQILPCSTTGARRRPVRAIWKSSIDDQCFSTIHGPNVNQCAIFIRSASISHERIQICRVRVVVTSAGAVHLAQTSNRKGFILAFGLRRVGAIMEAVIMVVVVFICSVEPKTREDSERCSG